MNSTYNEVSEEMKALEDLAEIDLDLALQKMTDLYFRASKALNHEVCDSIELWIYGSKSSSLVEFLNERIKENIIETDLYRKWIEQSS